MMQVSIPATVHEAEILGPEAGRQIFRQKVGQEEKIFRSLARSHLLEEKGSGFWGYAQVQECPERNFAPGGLKPDPAAAAGVIPARAELSPAPLKSFEIVEAAVQGFFFDFI
jgi:hypothetical protein